MDFFFFRGLTMKNRSRKTQQMYTDGGWHSSIPNLREELRQAKLEKIQQTDLAKRYNVSLATIRVAIKEFGLLPWIYAPKH